ncbi:hypothetical protein NM688_g2903 [Phlebia brevispora]|uniref:Uncharacterized protein n=1 Tax=Phlebia brevispora TaxID=194682 RepID=A0ACC1T790_9APHY|nr:hypothetical protein NM688_g2903 [Phlebia brevispora]
MPRSKRYQQLVSPGLGRQYISPKKSDRHIRLADKARVPQLGLNGRIRALNTKLQALLSSASPGIVVEEPSAPDASLQQETVEENHLCTVESVNEEGSKHSEEKAHSAKSTPRKRRLFPDGKTHKFYDRFRSLLPDLEKPYLEYTERSMKRPTVTTFTPTCATCSNSFCPSTASPVTLLFWDHFEVHNIWHCECTSLPVVLVRNGMFPSAPSDPHLAISIDLLDFYYMLFQRSGDAITAMAAALHKFYIHRGWQVVNVKGESIKDPFRRGLGSAIQWYEMLRVNIEKKVESVVDSARRSVIIARQKGIEGRKGNQKPTSNSSESAGGDIHVALDANFSHRHLKSAGDSPPFYEPSYFLPDEFVKEIGDRIADKRKKPINKKWIPPVPDSAVDACQHGHEAANEHKVKTADRRFDDTGVMALICRHDVPLLLVNLDTPGEQQKYAIALLEHLFSLIPPHATVGAYYDIACVLHRSVNRYGLLADSIIDRLGWITSAMHAYGHGWACQLVYAPRFRQGSGDTDGEGVERLWSKLRIIIPVSRTSSRPRRVWLLDHQVKMIGETTFADLGQNIQRRYRRAEQEGLKACESLNLCGVEEHELQKEWEMQKRDQTSVRNHAPARLKKDLDAILTLQAEVDKLQGVISGTQILLNSTYTTVGAKGQLDRLQAIHTTLASQVEQLYAALNIDYLPPELKDLSLEFLRTLILARDLKTNIRLRVIANWMEWDRLDQAAGGRDVALGTKLHQETRKKIAKRKPALLALFKKFNGYCDVLSRIRPSWCNIPTPSPLPVDLIALRDDPHFMEDVWIAPSATADPPRWLQDENIRHGILSMHRRLRSVEEKERCAEEAQNMCLWYGEELAAIEVALRLPSNAIYSHLLQTRREEHHLRRFRWSTSLVPLDRYNEEVHAAVLTADDICGPSADIRPPDEIQHALPEHHAESGDHADDEDEDEDDILDGADVDGILLSDLVEDMLQDDIGIPLPENSQDDLASHVEPSNTMGECDELTAQWIMPPWYRVDFFPELFCTQPTVPSVHELARTRAYTFGQNRVFFRARDLAILADPTSQLNDVCINDCAILLREKFRNSRCSCAVFNTFDINYVRQGSPERLRKAAERTEYWKYDLWIIPLHQPRRNHWTLVVLVLSTRTAYYFDSLAVQEGWIDEVQEALELFNILGAKSSNSTRRWSAHPLLIHPIQRNIHDCGLWVLAAMTAVFRGYEVTGLAELAMPIFRNYLLQLALALPSTASSE